METLGFQATDRLPWAVRSALVVGAMAGMHQEWTLGLVLSLSSVFVSVCFLFLSVWISVWIGLSIALISDSGLQQYPIPQQPDTSVSSTIELVVDHNHKQ